MDPIGDISKVDQVIEVVQITRVVAVCRDKKGKEHEIVIASNRRPLPVPYSEEP